MPVLRESESIAILLGCVEAAKTFNNDYMTEIIRKSKSQSLKSPSSKKQDNEGATEAGATSSKNGDDPPKKRTKV